MSRKLYYCIYKSFYRKYLECKVKVQQRIFPPCRSPGDIRNTLTLWCAAQWYTVGTDWKAGFCFIMLVFTLMEGLLRVKPVLLVHTNSGSSPSLLLNQYVHKSSPRLGRPSSLSCFHSFSCLIFWKETSSCFLNKKQNNKSNV